MNFFRTTIFSLALLATAPIFAAGDSLDHLSSTQHIDEAKSNRKLSAKLQAFAVKHKKPLAAGALTTLAVVGTAVAYNNSDTVKDTLDDAAASAKKFFKKHKVAVSATTASLAALAIGYYFDVHTKAITKAKTLFKSAPAA